MIASCLQRRASQCGPVVGMFPAHGAGDEGGLNAASPLPASWWQRPRGAEEAVFSPRKAQRPARSLSCSGSFSACSRGGRMELEGLTTPCVCFKVDFGCCIFCFCLRGTSCQDGALEIWSKLSTRGVPAINSRAGRRWGVWEVMRSLEAEIAVCRFAFGGSLGAGGPRGSPRSLQSRRG